MAGRSKHFEKVFREFDEVDSYSALSLLEEGGDQVEVARRYSDMIKWIYKERKAISKVVRFAQAGIQYALRASGQDHEHSAELKGIAKTIAYNLGSYTWIGWDEKEIEISVADCLVGYDAALVNYRLAEELGRGDDVKGNAAWLVAAHTLVLETPEQAMPQFDAAAASFKAAGKDTYVMMCVGYYLIAEELAGTGKKGELAGVLKLLKERHGEEGLFFAEQISTARKVFKRWYR